MGNLKGALVDLAFDSSYPTGGESVTPEQCGLNVIQYFNAANNSGHSFEYDLSGEKVVVTVPIGVVAGEGVADDDNTLMKSATGTLEVAGTGTAFQQPAVQVADKSDLSDVTTRALVLGW
jgi:hypothetical protein